MIMTAPTADWAVMNDEDEPSRRSRPHRHVVDVTGNRSSAANVLNEAMQYVDQLRSVAAAHGPKPSPMQRPGPGGLHQGLLRVSSPGRL